MTNQNTLMGVLEDVTGGNSGGVGYVLRDTMLHHIVEANLPDPTGTNFYEGWLVKKTPTLKFFSTGEMKKQPDGSYTLNYSSNSLYQGYNDVVITLETIRDSTPEAHILEGIVQ